MSKNLFDFNAQLNTGNSGEADFVKFYKEYEPQKSSDRKIDFFLNDGKSVELKTDTYPMEATPNFFMEFFGDAASGKIGGPWRALDDKVDFFVYYFTKNKTFFWFQTPALVDTLNKIIDQRRLQMKRIRNRTWVTEGYAVPRSELESVIIRKDTF